MTVINPAAHKLLVKTGGAANLLEQTSSGWFGDLLAHMLTNPATYLLDISISNSAPVDTKKLWFDPAGTTQADSENGQGQLKVYVSGSWVNVTPANFANWWATRVTEPPPIFTEATTAPTVSLIGHVWRNTSNATVSGIPAGLYGIWNGATWLRYGRHNVVSQNTPPANPQLGDVWVDTDEGSIYMRLTDNVTNVWVDIGSIGGSTSASVPVTSPTAPTSPTLGALWLDSDDLVLYIWLSDGVQNVWMDISSIAGTSFSTGQIDTIKSTAVAEVNSKRTMLVYTPGTYSWTAPANITKVRARGRAGAAGGGGSTGSGTASGGGGSGGSYFDGWFAVVPGTNYAITVGAGGVAGLSSGGNGGNGGLTSFSTLASAPGGLGGNGGNSSNGTGGAAPAIATGGSINFAGAPGTNGSATQGGTGGGSYLQSASNVISLGAGAGLDGRFPGIGGNGAAGNGNAGGAGAPGELILEF